MLSFSVLIDKFRASLAALLLAGGLLFPVVVQAHFMFLVPTAADKPEARSVHLIFSELAVTPEANLFQLVEKVPVKQLIDGKLTDPLETTKTDEGFLVKPAAGDGSRHFIAEKIFGVRTKGEQTFLLKYYAKGYTGALTSGTVPGWDLEAVPSINGTSATLHCTWKGTPVAEAEIVVQLKDGSNAEGKTNEQGDFAFSVEKQDIVAARVKHVEQVSGEFEGKQYPEVRHYLTVTFDNDSAAKSEVAVAKPASPFPDMPLAVASFGAGIVDNSLYVYGGNTGKAHDYYVGTQSDKLYRLKLEPGSSWEELGTSTPLQGVSMAAYGGKVFRVGGFNARNKQGEKQDLFSTDEVAMFDPQSGKWTNLPPLPEPRSSHDVAVLGDTLYVVGGWSMQGNASKTVWLETAWAYDLTKGLEGAWKEIAHPTSNRRALTLAAHHGKLYAIGGMYQEGGTTTETLVYDPATDAWTQGPELSEEDGDGFGVSAFAEGGKLYASGISGKLLRLSEDAQTWEPVGEMAQKRFFHRMLPMQDGQLLIVGGTAMKTGKIRQLEVLASP